MDASHAVAEHGLPGPLLHTPVPAPAKGHGRRRTESPFADTWDEVDRAVSAIIDRATFADLLRGWAEKQNRFVLNWEI